MEIQGLRRELKLWDLVLFNVVAIVGLRWLPLAAASGFASITVWLLAILFFFLPQGFAVAELSSRHPDEGGIYVWTKKAFGDFHGFICGWCYWSSNLTFYPSALIAGAGIAALIGGEQSKHFADNQTFIAVVTLAILWIAIGANILGVKQGKWLHNLGGITTWLPAMLLILLGVISLVTRGSSNPFELSSFIPDVHSFATLSLWSTLCFALAGLELPATMGGEIQQP